MILTDELCDRLCAAAKEKSKELGIDISFAISDEHGVIREMHGTSGMPEHRGYAS